MEIYCFLPMATSFHVVNSIYLLSMTWRFLVQTRSRDCSFIDNRLNFFSPTHKFCDSLRRTLSVAWLCEISLNDCEILVELSMEKFCWKTWKAEEKLCLTNWLVLCEVFLLQIMGLRLSWWKLDNGLGWEFFINFVYNFKTWN